MQNLTDKEKEFVALGAAMGSNCIPCIVYHIEESKKLGISVEQIKQAIAMADKVRKVPIEKGFNTALAQLGENIEICDKTDCNPSKCNQ